MAEINLVECSGSLAVRVQEIPKAQGQGGKSQSLKVLNRIFPVLSRKGFLPQNPGSGPNYGSSDTPIASNPNFASRASSMEDRPLTAMAPTTC